MKRRAALSRGERENRKKSIREEKNDDINSEIMNRPPDNKPNAIFLVVLL